MKSVPVYCALFILLLPLGCKHQSAEEAGGFLALSEPLNYELMYIPVETYPEIIDRKMLSYNKKTFPDSLLKTKKVVLVRRINFHPGTKKVDYIDTAGYDVVVKNDSLELLWLLDFDTQLKCTRDEERTFERHKQFIQEGEEIRKQMIR